MSPARTAAPGRDQVRSAVPKRFTITPAHDRLIHEAYAQYRDGGDRQALNRAAARLGWPKWALSRRCGELGLSRIKEPVWCDHEEQLLERWGHLTAPVIAKKFREAGYARSVNAIHIKLVRLRVKSNLGGYSEYSLSCALGIDAHCVGRWIGKGWLKAERRPTARTASQGGDPWWIRHEDVKDFVLRYPDEIDLRKVEKWWFLDLITDGRICR